MSNSRLLRILSGLCVPLWFVGLTALPLVLLRNRLPDPLTTNWGLGGAPRGTMGCESFLTFCLVFTMAAGLVAAFASRRTKGVRIALSVAWFHGALFAGISLTVVHANLDAPIASQARQMALWQVLITVAGAAAVGWAGSRLGRLLEDPPPLVPAPKTGVEPEDGEVWVGTAHSRWALPAMTAMVCSGLLLASTLQPRLGMVLAATSLICLLSPTSASRWIVRDCASSTAPSGGPYSVFRWMRFSRPPLSTSSRASGAAGATGECCASLAKPPSFCGAVRASCWN